ncbi:hypothetical protein ACTL6P_15360 [Endozoicomonas acroporae]|uniref:hypothetical protein n=1 Tax=Endozoicomonas acroporae TaxID=1701104 RepID=UPI000C76DB00|nr:hypothetical protein [Endozoicomonas acroporae]
MKSRRNKAIDLESKEAKNFIDSANATQSVVITSSKTASKNANTKKNTEKDAIKSEKTDNYRNTDASGDSDKMAEAKEKQALLEEYEAIFDHSPKGKVSKSKPYSLRMNAYQNALIDFICKVEDISKIDLINECLFNKDNLPEMLKKAKAKVDKM